MTRILITGIISLSLCQLANADNPVWGQLANPGFENQPIKSTLFFTGNWRNEVQFYDYNPTSNIGLYTIFPDDSRHLGWSENYAYREFAVNILIDAGVNVINMSYWGLPGTDNWAYWAPMQTSTESHDELFDVALNKHILIAPFIESFAATDSCEGFSFMDDFPGTADNPAPQLIELIEDLVDRYLVNPENEQWPDKWARVYDPEGVERYLISIIHVASNQSSITDKIFAEGFDRVAANIYSHTGKLVGFALDILPPDTYAPGSFKATPGNTGSWLVQQFPVLAIQCFIPEIWTGQSDENALITWKNNFAQGWINTGIPFIHDISPGYDAHIVFPGSPLYGNNSLWRNLQDQAINNFGSESFTFNAWNGYTEGFAGVPTEEYGDTTYQWVCGIYGGTCGSTNKIISPSEKNNIHITIYPNPSSNIFTIDIDISEPSWIKITVYDGIGNEIEKLTNRLLKLGRNTIEWHPSGLDPGIYFISAETEKIRAIEEIVLLF